MINMLVNLAYLACMIVFFLFGVAIAPVLRSDINNTHTTTNTHTMNEQHHSTQQLDQPTLDTPAHQDHAQVLAAANLLNRYLNDDDLEFDRRTQQTVDGAMYNLRELML